MRTTVRAALVLLAGLGLLTGAAYPGLVTLAANLLYPRQANGSLIRRGDVFVGSRLIAQECAGARWFHGRPSAAPKGPGDLRLSGGSNLGPLHPAWLDSVLARAATCRDREASAAPVPIDLVTASGSGLDPHISPAAAYDQVRRVARARGLPEASVRELVDRRVEPRTWGLLGEPRVNVLELNLALAALGEGEGREAALPDGAGR